MDKHSPVPLYQQVKEHIWELIDGRVWREGTRLPSEREWIAQLDISRITVRQALRDLVAEGYLASAPGKGFFVAPRPEPQELRALLSHTQAMTNDGVDPSSRVLDCSVRAASPVVAARLRLTTGAEVVHLARVRMGDGVPLTVQRVWLPHALVPGLAETDFTRASLFEQLQDRYGLRPVKADTTVSARLADAQEARELELGDPPLGLSVDQLTWDEHHRVIEFSRSLHHPWRLPIRIGQDLPAHQGAVTVTARPGAHGDDERN
ncbi:GntR family transcriptional regulator [Nonomuraea sp. NPDC050783]|uniref:GntR family transcriptional regulator n=1 Tax=Nonomuraea sp. NPDC050783 TaxID=3154634 RepID=UPI003465D197